MERQKQLGSTIRHNSGASPVGLVDVKIPKQDKVGGSVRNSSRTKEITSWVSDQKSSSSGWLSEEVGEIFCVLYTLWIMASLKPSTLTKKQT